MRLKPYFIFGFFCLITHCLNAQTPVCQPDSVRYRDSASGVYPLPYIATTRPNGGINKPACIGKAYNFVWTVKMGDSVTIPNPSIPGTTLAAAVDSITVTTTGGIQGLPTGITYACNPPNCVFKRRTNGCVVLSGTPAATNVVKIYPLIITATAFPSDALYKLLLPNGYTGTLPGSFADGKYDLSLSNATCGVRTKDLTQLTGVVALPNPTNGKTTIFVESTIADKFEFSLTDLVGRQIQQRPLSIQVGRNAFDIDLTDLANGVYIYSLKKGNQLLSNKLIVNH